MEKIVMLMSLVMVVVLGCVSAQDPTTTTTTVKPTPGPDDLTSTDYIIIGVACLVFLCVFIGGIVFCCLKSKEEAKEKEELYNRYLQADQMKGQTNGGYRA